MSPYKNHGNLQSSEHRRTIFEVITSHFNESLTACLRACLKLLWAAYLLVTSLYCLLAFFPYTYYALIKSPVYEWMPWFAHQHAWLYWVALLAALGGYWGLLKRALAARLIFGVLLVVGVFISVRPFLANLDGGPAAYAWSVAALVPALLFSLLDAIYSWPGDFHFSQGSIAYAPAVLSACAVAVLSLFGPMIHDRQIGTVISRRAEMQTGFWSIISHTVLAVLVVSVLNLVLMAASRTARPRLTRISIISVAVFAGAFFGVRSFLEAAFGFAGWRADLYSSLLVATLIALALSVVLALQTQLQRSRSNVKKSVPRIVFALTALALAMLAVILPSAINEWDWNGLFQWLFTAFVWCGLTACVYLFWRRQVSYSLPAIIAALVVTIVSYKGLQFSDVIWGRALGSTTYEISESLENYAARDFSFRMAHHLLGNAPPEEPCGDFCRILRDYTNIRDAYTTRTITFTNPLTRSRGRHPNIFMIVVDSLRPDYLGVYNGRVDFTPNIDALAADSTVFHNTYSQYAGTYLSEPAIWSGAMLLHAHYVRPFDRVNALEQLLRTDDYRMVVSYDNVLSQLLSASDDAIKLDKDKPWKALEFCSTVSQLAHTLDGRSDSSRPTFFYAQPQNVHMFAANNLPTVRTTHWNRPGFDPRISLAVHQVDGCVGDLVSYLKTHAMYDESIIILASDHGDATGEFGRKAHSYSIYPEIMRVPLIVHLPRSMQGKFVYDANRITTLTDITPSLYYLLGHRPLANDPMLGEPLFTATQPELSAYHRDELFLASDEVPVYGLLDHGRFLYTTYASPARSFLFDLAADPNAEHNILTPDLKKEYDQRIIDHLKMIGDFYGYKLGIKAILASNNR